MTPLAPRQRGELAEACQRDAGAPGKRLLPLRGGRISQGWGENGAYYARWGLRGHNGEDWVNGPADRPITPPPSPPVNWGGIPEAWDDEVFWVYATGAGVLRVGSSDGYGLYAYVMGERWHWLFAHLAAIWVMDKGVAVPGEVIACMGYSGITVPAGIAGRHLHYGVRPAEMDRGNGYGGYVDPSGVRAA